MTKSTAQANSMVKVAALVVGGIYLYRRFTEGTAEELKASHTIPPLGQFITAWGVVFFGLSLIAGPWPAFAGDMAILVMIASILSNGVEISKDLNKGVLTYNQRVKRGELAGPPAPERHGGAETHRVKPPFETRSV